MIGCYQVNRKLVVAGFGVLVLGTALAVRADVPRIEAGTSDIPPQSTAPTHSVRMGASGMLRGWSPQIVDLPTTDTTAAVAGRAGNVYYGPGPAPRFVPLATGSIEIRLQQARFDPLRSAPALPEPLRVATVGLAGHDYFVLQFHGPLRPSDRQWIESLGGEILDYVPDFALLVRMGPAARTALGENDRLRWSAPYWPGFRLAAELLGPALQGRSGSRLPLLARGFAGEPSDTIETRLRLAGADQIEAWPDSGGGAIFRFQAETTQLLQLSRIRALAWIERDRPYSTGNAVARSNALIGKDRTEQTLGLYGQGQIVTVTDTGLSTGDTSTMHPDFAGRFVGWGTGPSANCSGWADTNSHGTHVAGSVLGSGLHSGANPGSGQYAGSQAGIAPRAGLLVWAGCNDLSGIPDGNMYTELWMPLYQFHEQLRVNNNSWGLTEPQSFGTYNIVARETDRFIRDFPDMVGVFIAHNSGRDNDGDGIADMFTVTPPGTAKNVITVGASENVRASGGFNPGSPVCFSWGSCWGNEFPAAPIKDDPLSDHAQGMAAFSGRGPTLSNRLKPDLVAPGTNIVSARYPGLSVGWGEHDANYMYQGGTSMAAPLVSGGAAIVREYFAKNWSHNPSAALVKAVLIHGARDLSPGQHGTGAQQEIWRVPDINQGWGRMDFVNTLIFDGPLQPNYFEVVPGVQTGQQLEQPIEIDTAGLPLKVTLVWTDAHGLEASHGALVNDLDLQLRTPDGSTQNGFAGNVGASQDRFNNFEAVHLPAAAAGVYTIRVTGFNVPAGPQPFAVVITGALSGDSIFTDRFQALP